MTQEALKLALEALESNKPNHLYCEDTWYSCPKHEDGCANEAEGDECNCGADEVNAQFDQAITSIKEALAQPERDYERGFIDGMQKQMQSSVDKAVNRMAQTQEPWCMKMNGCKTKCEDCPDEPPQRTEQEPVKIAHRHEWFRTGEMKVGQMRCISCGAWGQEEITQRTWVGLTNNDWNSTSYTAEFRAGAEWADDKLKDKNT